MKRAILLLAACGSPPAPTTSNVAVTVPVPAGEYGPPPHLEGDAAAQCKLTESRALACMDQLFVAYYRATTGFDLDDKLVDKHSDDAEARAIHMTTCLGDLDLAYMKNLVVCWNERGCDAFATCVGKRTKRLQ